MGVDVDDSTIPQETGLAEQAVSFDKGCYLGQELVARLDSRGGRVNRHLRGVISGSVMGPGLVVGRSGETAGRVSSVAWSESLGAHIGLGLLHRSVQPGHEVAVAGTIATVVELPFVQTGRAA
jgi:folate-binding protein YgfZ